MFIVYEGIGGGWNRLAAIGQGLCRLHLVVPNSAYFFNPIILNHRITQNVAGNSVQIFARIERDFEKFALPDLFYPFVTQTGQRGANGLALGIEDGLFEGYVDACFH